ncbi:TIGR01777 family oxidoreductase [Vibrio profundum]|uniref:TIGR01777 family oxidoreductase n=1 Tax=Vibrio profundum TaxID=2910247 RepID=UPI003D0F8156
MKILVTGGSGFIGQELLKHLATHQLVLLTRNVVRARSALKHIAQTNISYITTLSDLHDLNCFDAVINLAGEPIIDKRWTTKQKQVLCDSRWTITERLVELIHASTEPPGTFLSGSAVGYYGCQFDQPFDENLHVNQEHFSHRLCSEWEHIAMRARTPDIRVCLLRTGIVLKADGGALGKMLLPFKFGLGGKIGTGTQYMPWIHMQDMVRGILYLLKTPHAHGTFNLCAPHPVTNDDFSCTLAKCVKRPCLMTTPTWLIKLAMGERSQLLLDSVRAKPKRLTELGFEFNFSRLEPALKNLLHLSQ